MSDESILISIIVCCYNESNYIDACLDSLLNQKYLPGKIEILVIDGESTDDTKLKVLNKQNRDSRIIFLNNPARVKPQAINLGFKKSKGEFIAICDAHALYDETYLSISLNILNEHQDVWCAGGPFINIGRSAFGKANAIAMNSIIGIGNAKHRHPEFEGYGEMVMFGLFRKNVLHLVGYYDEFFIINHDDEYCFRLRKIGGKVFLSYKAKCYYFVRETPKSLFKQYFSYGLWQIAFLKKHKIPISLRQLVPFSFFSTIFLLILIGFLLKNIFILISLPCIYFFVLLIYSSLLLFKNDLKIVLNFPLSVFILHFSYAIGFFIGFFKFFKNKFDK